jgi:3-oxoacyl-[acyl-carrier-protein] synthase-3
MGSRIESVATARSRTGIFGRGGLRLSDAAARECLHRAHRKADDLDLLVNAGMYKERNMAEPALASIIQEDIGANPGHPSRRDRHGTFSFDVLNGACGVLTAAHLVDAFVGEGRARLGMIVAADADPSPRTSHGFPFTAVGGALLLEHTDGNEGFVAFDFRTFPELSDLFEVRLRFEPRTPGVFHRARNVIDVKESASFASQCVRCANEVARTFLERCGLGPPSVDLLVTSQYPPTFGEELARAMGIASDRLPHVSPELALCHTAGPLAALEGSIASGQLARARHVLFVTAGAGITIGVALYASFTD